jgi:hypothetical protein
MSPITVISSSCALDLATDGGAGGTDERRLDGGGGGGREAKDTEGSE